MTSKISSNSVTSGFPDQGPVVQLCIREYIPLENNWSSLPLSSSIIEKKSTELVPGWPLYKFSCLDVPATLVYHSVPAAAIWDWKFSLQLRHNDHDGVSNHQPHDCLLKHLFRCRSKETSKLRVTGLCAGNSPVAGEFPAQMASNAENVSIWWRHLVFQLQRDSLDLVS